MLPLSPLEPELAVAIVMEPESSAVPTPLVTLTAPPVLAPRPPSMDTAPPSDPLLPSLNASLQRQRASCGAVSGGLACGHGHRPAGPVLPSPTLREIAPPAPPVAIARLHRKRPRRPKSRGPGCQRHVAAHGLDSESAVAIVWSLSRPQFRRRSSHSRRRPCSPEATLDGHGATL